MKNFLCFVVITATSIYSALAQCTADTDFTFTTGSRDSLEWCKTDGNIFGKKDGNGTFSSTPENLFSGFRANSGFINLNDASVNPGVYQVTFTSQSCPTASTTKTFIISSPGVANGSFSYNGDENGFSSFCQATNKIQPTITGDPGGIFSVDAPDGGYLELNTTTGEIDLAASFPNATPYQIFYTVKKTCGGDEVNDVQSHTITIYEYIEADFTYGATNFCKGSEDPKATIASGFSGADGSFEWALAAVAENDGTEELIFSDETLGSIDLQASDPGVYDVTLRFDFECVEESHTERIIIDDVIDVNFQLAPDDRRIFCGQPGDPVPVPTDFTAGGVFTAVPAGLVINATSGAIDFASSVAGFYDITYTYDNGDCFYEYTLTNIQIKIPTPAVENLQEFCENINPTINNLVAVAPGGFQIRWYDTATSETVLNPPATDDEPNPTYGDLVSKTYYVATFSRSCDSETDRMPVTVRVYGSSYPLVPLAAVDSETFVDSPTTITLTAGQSLSLGLDKNYTGTVNWSGPNGYSATGDIAVIATNLSAADAGSYTATVDLANCNESSSITYDLIVESTTLVISPKVFLQGAMLSTTDGLMRDDLRALEYLPLTSPYNDGIAVASSMFVDHTSNPETNIVDWVWIELRDATDPTMMITGQSALLQRNGEIVNTLGQPLQFEGAVGAYYIVINHRNHLGIMSKNPISLSDTETIVNFSTSVGTATFGTEAQTSFGMPTGTLGMWAGDADGDDSVKFSGINNDLKLMRSLVLTDPDNTSNFIGYNVRGFNSSDINLNGGVKYSGLNNDRNLVRSNILIHPNNTADFVGFTIKSNIPK